MTTFSVMFRCLFLFALTLPFALRAQDAVPSPAQQLAQKITRGIENDSLKVVAVHDWITKNVSYDVNKFMRMNYDRVDEKTLVKKRKATCVGYADLFNLMCGYSGVASVSVSGYSKNNYTDLGDTCFLEDHMWNAVLVNGRWHLVDATWDAGYVTFTQSSVIGKMLKAVTGKERRKYKPRFVRAPHKTYLMRNGGFFYVDHFPGNADWLLLTPSPRIRDFERDSAYFFQRYPERSVHFAANDAQARYTTLDPVERIVADGLASHTANPNNRFDAGIAWYAMAMQQWHAKPAATEAAAYAVKCDSVLTKLDSALTHHAGADAMLAKEKQYQLAKNERKAAVFQSYLKETKAATNRNVQEAKRFPSTYGNGKKSMKDWHATNVKRLDAMRDDNYFMTKNARVTRTEDSVKYSKEFLLFTDSLHKTLRAYDVATKGMDSLYIQTAQRVNAYNGIALELIKRHKNILLARQAFYDDFDWEVIAQRQALAKRRHTADSLLYTNDTSVFKQLYKDYSTLHRHANLVYQVHRSRMQAMKRLRTATVRSTSIDSAYSAAYDSLVAFITEADASESKWNSRAGQIASLSKTTRKTSEKILKALDEERLAETVNNRARTTHVTKRIASVSKENLAVTNRTKKLRLTVAQAKESRKS